MWAEFPFLYSDFEHTDDSDVEEIDYPDGREEEFLRPASPIWWTAILPMPPRQPPIQMIMRPEPKKKLNLKKVKIRPNHICPICMETNDVKQQNVYCNAACGQTFHSQCVIRQTKCPICRATADFHFLPNKEKSS